MNQCRAGPERSRGKRKGSGLLLAKGTARAETCGDTKKILIYAGTLRDGTQGGGMSLSVSDKVQIAKRLDALRFDYIEGGWPGSNPKDIEFFYTIRDVPLKYAKVAARIKELNVF